MKRIMLVGRTSCGKTTLTQVLRQEELRYKKTQDIQFSSDVIDTPGEYLENVGYYRALMVTGVEAGAVVLMQACDEAATLFPPGFGGMFGGKPVIGVVSKSDLCEEERVLWAEDCLLRAGASRIFRISALSGEGMAEYRDFLKSL